MRYTDEMIEWLKAYTPNHSYKEITQAFNERFKCNQSLVALASYNKRLKIKNGVDGRFYKGHTPYTKGLKITEYASPEAIERSSKTRFYKGQPSINKKPIGSERVDRDGYILVKTAEPNKWSFKHRVVWERTYGAIPKGMIIMFLDQNRANCSIDNLCLCSKGDMAVINHEIKLTDDPELNRAVVNIAKLKNVIHNKKRGK